MILLLCVYIIANLFGFLFIENDLLKVLEAITMVTDWYELGLKLGLNVDILEKIENDCCSVKECQRKMILKWLNTGCACWSSLVEALNSPLVNRQGIAKLITKDHLHMS